MINLVFDENKIEEYGGEDTYPKVDEPIKKVQEEEAYTIIERIFRYVENKVRLVNHSHLGINTIKPSAREIIGSTYDMQILASFMILGGLFVGYGDIWLNNMNITVGAFTFPLVYLLMFLILFKRQNFSKADLTLVYYLFGWGVFSGILSATTNILISNTVTPIPAAFIEEPFKILGLFLLAKAGILKSNSDNDFNWILYGAAAGAGFASIENIQYILGMTSTGEFTLYSAIILRSTVSFSHIAWSAVIGKILGLAMSLRNKVLLRDLLLGLAIAIPLHAFWNSFYMLRGPVVLPLTLLLIYEEVESIYTPKIE